MERLSANFAKVLNPGNHSRHDVGSDLVHPLQGEHWRLNFPEAFGGER